MKMEKNIEKDTTYFDKLISDMDKDLEYIAEENLNLAKTYFKSINSLLNINPPLFLKQAFENLAKLNEFELINDNCSNTLFVWGWLYERLADSLESKIGDVKSKELFLVSACEALSKYKLANSNRQKYLFEKYEEQKHLIDIIDTAYDKGYDIGDDDE